MNTDSIARVVSFEQVVAKRNRQVNNLSQSVIERDQCIASLEQEIKGCNQRIINLDQEISVCNQHIVNLDQHIVNLGQEINERDNRIEAFVSSKSWKITKPLRWYSRQMRRIVLFVKLMPRAISLKGGFLPFAASVVRVTFTEGIAGLRLELRAIQMQKLQQLPASEKNSTNIILINESNEIPEEPKELPENLNQVSCVKPNEQAILHELLDELKNAPEDLSLDEDLNQIFCINPDKQTILIVSHDASRTGAPILSLNLVQAFAKRYNVVVLLLGPGELIEAFQLAGVEVVLDFFARTNPDHAICTISDICKRYKLLFALVNSIESRAVLPVLVSFYVPTISLLHEFASYTRPYDAFCDAILWSTRTVFSTQLTLENALHECPGLNDFSIEVIPQGKCSIASKEITTAEYETERLRLIKQIRPGGRENDDIVVIMGAGSVILRKGVDLFIECASRVIKSPGGDKCRFVWIGHGYNPNNDIFYSVYLADQIQRAGLEKHMVFVEETSEIELAYQLADIFLLSPRLDPLPNVAIDVMYHGLPVICFDKATGIADFLIQNELGSYCVAGYLDTLELSQKVLAMVESKILRKQIGDRCKAAAVKTFCMEDYVSRLDSLALSACEQISQEKLDIQEILESGIFQENFFLSSEVQKTSAISTIEDYVRSWKTNVWRRKPCPGFHPGIYLEHYDLAKKEFDLFADYLRNRSPQGPWNYEVITSGSSIRESLGDSVRVALHIHAYYPDLLPDIINRLELNKIRPDLFISVKDELSLQQTREILSGYVGDIVDIKVTPNIGRNIGPLLTAFGKQLIDNYDFIGHLHTKKSLDIGNHDFVAIWNNFLLENLLGGNFGGQMMDVIISTMVGNKNLDIVFPDDPYAVSWNANILIAEQIALKLDISKLPQEFNFPVGAMFWIRSSLLKRFVDLGYSWEDYPSEPLSYDGTMLHALERLFGAIVFENMKYAVTYVPGVTR